MKKKEKKQKTNKTKEEIKTTKFYKNNDDIIVGLKKIKNEKKSTNSNSLLMSQKMNKKNIFIKGHLKSLTSGKFLMDFKENSKSKSKSKSKNKENKKRSKIKVNQKILIDDKYNNLIELCLKKINLKNIELSKEIKNININPLAITLLKLTLSIKAFHHQSSHKSFFIFLVF